MIRDSAGSRYGTTNGGPANHGVLYKLDTAGQYTVLYTFTGGADGGSPQGGVIMDSAGNLCGTTQGGGNGACPGGCAVVYNVDAAGHETVLYSFTGGADGANPYAGVIADAAGNLYGTTPWGGMGGSSSVEYSGGGVVYKIGPR